jgi:hypothetical protein
LSYRWHWTTLYDGYSTHENPTCLENFDWVQMASARNTAGIPQVCNYILTATKGKSSEPRPANHSKHAQYRVNGDNYETENYRYRQTDQRMYKPVYKRTYISWSIKHNDGVSSVISERYTYEKFTRSQWQVVTTVSIRQKLRKRPPARYRWDVVVLEDLANTTREQTSSTSRRLVVFTMSW